MSITDEDIRAFQALWRAEFGEVLSPEEAKIKIGRLDELYLVLARKDRANEGRREEDAFHAPHP